MTPSFQTLSAITGYRQEGQTLLLDCGGPCVAITPLTDQIIRVRFAPQGTFVPRRSWDVAFPDEAFPGAALELIETPSALLLRTAALTVQISRDPCRISFLDPQGTPFCADSDGLTWSTDPSEPLVCAKQIAPEEHFYGCGERSGQLDQSGLERVNWATDTFRYGPGTDPLYIAIPTVMALRPGLAYGLFFHTTWRSRFDFGHDRPGSWLMETAGPEIDYYLLAGPTPAEVTRGLGQVLGTMPLPPRWALGYHQSRWSYGSDVLTRELTAEFRQRDIPCDAIHLDIDYMDGYRDFTWHPDRFPNPQALTSDLRQQGFRLIGIIDAGVKIDPEYPVYQDGMERNMFIRRTDGSLFHGYVWPDDSVFPDFSRADVRSWWGTHQHQLTSAGISGIWNDMNEPTVFGIPFSQGGGLPRTIDLDVPQGSEIERTTHAELHNMYGSGMAQASFEGLKRSLGTRPFVLTRSGYAGIQRWSACWMGDNSSRWEHLEMAMPQLLNMGLSGVAFVGTDIGGFFDNASGELFARWMQLGALMPFCRGHSSADTERHEPWVFGPEVEAICREYLKLRYRLMPYLYSLFWESSQRGAPVLRPLLYEFPNDTTTYTLHDQVMLGAGLMAAPIYQQGREHRVVYLPAGTWYDWWTEERIEGPVHRLVHAPIERLPLYVRGGSILPSGPDMQWTDERALDTLTLDIYPGNGSFTLYEDDGNSLAYERDEWCTTSYRQEYANGRLRLEIGARNGQYQPVARQMVLRIHNAGPGAAQALPGASYDAELHLLTVSLADSGQAMRWDIVLDAA